MLNAKAFAGAAAGVAGIFYLAFYILWVAARGLFDVLFNAQFLGANVASLIPGGFTFSDFLVTLVIVVITSWAAGYAFVWMYNMMMKK